MKEITASESRKIMLSILQDVSEFCDNNGLSYYLAYGTLIGAVRHKGFIPWDDDIDIVMPRPDYEIFISSYHESGKYAISSPFYDKDHFLVFSKVFDSRTVKYEEGIDYSRFSALGVDIDVFPLDGIPSGAEEIKYEKLIKQGNRIGSLLFRAISPKRQHTSLKGKIAELSLNPLCRIIGKDYFIKSFIQIARQYKYEDCDYVHVAFPLSSNNKEKYSKSIFRDKVKVQFEGNLYWAPIGYDDMLRGYYGDYMQLPPVEKRATHHRNTIFWK